jgi:hypothetical protein
MDDFLAYFAGYLDGDGHFRFKKYVKNGRIGYTCKIMITSTNEDPLKLFKQHLGGAYYSKTQSNLRWKPEFIYTLHIGKTTYNRIKSIEHILIEKSSQFNFVYSFLNGSSEQRDTIIQLAKLERSSSKINRSIFDEIKIRRKSIVYTRNDIIYLSGYIDAECCLTVTRKKLKTGSISFSCHLRASMTKFQCADFVMSRFGGCISYHKSTSIGASDCIQWQLTNQSLEPILNLIYPFLINKKRQCEQLIALRATFKEKKFPRDIQFQTYYNQNLPIRNTIFDNLKLLNKRGT